MNPDVVSASDKWLPAFQLPPDPGPGVKDLKGRTVRVSKFLDDATVRFFFPHRTLSFQQRMVKRLVRSFRKRGAGIDSVRTTVEDYARWCEAEGKIDTPELRYQFATIPPDFVIGEKSDPGEA